MMSRSLKRGRLFVLGEIMGKAFWSGAAILWSIALGFLYYLVTCHVLPNPQAAIGPLVIYVSALLAFAGWMVQTWNAARVGRKQHSMNLLMQTRLSAVHKEHLVTVGTAFSGAKVFDLTTIKSNKNLERSVTYLVNYYEFIAVALLHRDLDEKIMRDAIRQQLCGTVERAEDFINDSLGIVDGKATYPLVYKNLRTLNARWAKWHTRRAKKLAKRNSSAVA